MSFGGQIKLTGEGDYRRALKQITNDLKTTSNALKTQAADFMSNNKAIVNSAEREKELNKTIADNKTAIENAQKSYSQYTVALQTQQTRHNALNKEYRQAILELDRIKKESGETSDEYKKQAQKVNDLEGQLVESTDEMNKSKSAMSDLKRTINEASKTMRTAENDAEGLGDELEQSGEDAENSSDGYTTFKNVVANLASQVLTNAISKLKEFASATVQAGASFEAAMSKVEAVSGASGKDLEALTQKAQEMGAKTKFSASESAEAFNYMAMAGWKTGDMLNGIEGVMNLAAASGEDLATSSDIVTDALTAMGYKAKDAGKLADVMAAASSNANTNVGMMGATFRYAAPIVGSMGYTMEDTAVAIGLMANAGIKADKAGTALRSIMSRLAAPTKESGTAMDMLNLSIKKSDGTMKPLRNIMDELRKKFKSMGEAEKAATAKHLAGQNAMSGLLAIVNAAPADYNKLIKAVDHSKGSAKKMADTMENNVAGSMTKLKSQIEGVQIQIFKKLAPSFQTALKEASKLIKGADWDKFAETAKGAINGLLSVIKWFVQNIGLVTTAINVMLGAFAVKKVWDFTKTISGLGQALVGLISNIITTTTAEGGLAAAQEALNVAMNANPVGAVVLALTALVGIVVALNAAMSESNKTHQENMEYLEKESEEIDANVKAYEDLEKQKQQTIDAGMTEMSNYKALWDELQTIVDQNGKVKKGYEERASFITDTLSKALGIEIEDVKGVIKHYDKLKDKIDSVMEKKKAQIILDSQESLYKEAITKQTDETKKLDEYEAVLAARREERDHLQRERDAKQAQLDNAKSISLKKQYAQELATIDTKLAKKDEEVKNAESNYTTQENLVRKYAYNIGTYEKNMELAHKGEYDKMSTVTWEYYKGYTKAGEAQKKTLEAQIKTTQSTITRLTSLKKKEGTDIYNQQIETAKKQRDQLKADLKKYNSATEKGLSANEKAWIKNIGDTLSAVTGKDIEFKDAGKGNAQMYVNGEKKGKKLSTDAMQKICDDTVATVRTEENKGKYKGASTFLLGGFKNGMTDKKTQSGLFSVVRNLGGKILSTFMGSLKEKSPSKATEEMGVNLLKGLSIGVVKEQSQTLRQVSGVGRNVVNAFNASLSGTDSFGGLSVAMPTMSGANVTRNVVTRATAKTETDLIGAFKTALSEMKIELDDEVAGKFVEDTVARAVYS